MRSEPYGINDISIEQSQAMSRVLRQNREDEIEKVYCRKLTRKQQKFWDMEDQYELVEGYMGTRLSQEDKEFIIKLRRSI